MVLRHVRSDIERAAPCHEVTSVVALVTTEGDAPATGQTTSYAPGDDGAIKAGAALSYTDNGDGTITDNNTKLMWEKKSNGDGSLDDMDKVYSWTGVCSDGATACETNADCLR